MSIWTSDIRGVGAGRIARPALLLGRTLALTFTMTLPLAGCLSMPESGKMGLLSNGAGDSASAAVPALRRAALVQGDVVVVPPAGYCIDGDSIRDGVGGGAFALIAACQSLTGKLGGVAAEPAIITVSVSNRKRGGLDQPGADEMARAIGGARVMERINGDGLTLVHLADGGDVQVPGGDARHWRGVMVVNARVVGLALYGPKGSTVAGPTGKFLMIGMAEGILGASPFHDPFKPAEVAATETADPVKAPIALAAKTGKPKKNLLRRLFR